MSQPVNLLFLTHNYPRNRDDYSGIFISLLARQLVPLGIRPVIVAPHDVDVPEREERDGIRIYRFRYARRPERQTLAYRGDMHRQALRLPFGPMRFYRFLRAFEKTALQAVAHESIDVIAGHWLVPAGLVMRRLLRKAPRPMILYSHGTDIRLLDKYANHLGRYLQPLYAHLHRWLVVSSFLRDKVIAADHRLADKIDVLPLPHDENLFMRDPRQNKEDNLIVAVTRFTEQKRVDELIRAFHWVTREEPSARLEIYGTGPLEEHLRALISEQGLERQAVMLPPVSQRRLREVYNRAAVVVLNSHEEGFGLALSEAMLCGTAVVGADSGGIPDIIADGERGLLVEPGNITQLAESLIRMLRDRTYRDKLADCGYKYARATFASKPLAARNASLIREALAAGGEQ